MRESQADFNGMKVGEPIVFVEGNSMLVYIDLEVRIEWKLVELLTAQNNVRQGKFSFRWYYCSQYWRKDGVFAKSHVANYF